MKNTKININNLTCLWKVAGKAFENYFEYGATCYSHIKNTEWPNRIWTNKPLTQETVQEIALRMGMEDGLTFSRFSESKKKNPLITSDNFKLKSVQYGMSLPLTKKFEAQKTIDLKKVTGKNDAEIWSTAFYKAFKYHLSAETILKTKNDIQYILVFHKGQLLGTTVLLITNNALGIHSLGVLPEKRRQGFATEIMYQILNNAIEKKLTVATLQASEMAKEMYIKIGFSVDFLMENYQINKTYKAKVL